MPIETYRGFVLRSHPVTNQRGLEYGVVCARCSEWNQSTYDRLAGILKGNTDLIVNQGNCDIDGENVSGVVYTIFDEQHRDAPYNKERETKAFDALKQAIDFLWVA